MNWVRWNYEMNQYSRKVEQMLNWMHSQTRPWTDIYILVMKIMGYLIQRFPVRPSVYKVEMRLSEENYSKHHENKIDRIGAPVDKWNLSIGIHPQGQDFIEGPDYTAADNAPEYIVPELIMEQKTLVLLSHPFIGVFEFFSLPF